jgi:hypothetical protein
MVGRDTEVAVTLVVDEHGVEEYGVRDGFLP